MANKTIYHSLTSMDESPNSLILCMIHMPGLNEDKMNLPGTNSISYRHPESVLGIADTCKVYLRGLVGEGCNDIL